MAKSTIDIGLQIAQSRLMEFGISSRLGDVGELLIERRDGSTCQVGVRTSRSANNMKIGSVADFYVYIQRAGTASPTIQVFTRSEIAAIADGPTVTTMESHGLNAWYKILNDVKETI